ncbi:MAG: hypothetical protein E6Z88_09505, partial [Limosilactobacillus fermentum]|nr:hypothetical protein [Limosilactobacillus fermentum]
IIPCSHGPHLTREKTATALKTSCSIHYTGKLKIGYVRIIGVNSKQDFVKSEMNLLIYQLSI